MGPVGRAIELLRQTEEKLRALVSEATSAGDYSSVLTLAAWARTVNDLTKAPPFVENEPKSKLHKKALIATGVRKQLRQNNQNGYPRFLRQNNQLVRIAWSKRDRKEYRHKVPYSVLKLLTTAMADKGRDGRVFSTEELLPIHDSEQSEPVPNYQAYVGISLLKQTGLIDQHGRQGYSIPRIEEFRNTVEAVWTKLPNK